MSFILKFQSIRLLSAYSPNVNGNLFICHCFSSHSPDKIFQKKKKKLRTFVMVNIYD